MTNDPVRTIIRSHSGLDGWGDVGAEPPAEDVPSAPVVAGADHDPVPLIDTVRPQGSQQHAGLFVSTYT